MATYYGQTVDLIEDFEDETYTGWSETDASGYLNAYDNTAEKNGTYGMSCAVEGAVSYFGYDLAATRDSVSVGFWLFVPTIVGDVNTLAVFTHCTSPTNPATLISRAQFYVLSGQANLRMNGADTGTAIAISQNAWYWVAVKSVINAECTLKVYSAAEALIGTQTCTGNNTANCDALVIGNNITGDENFSFFFDDFVADWTDSTYPLLGWSSGSAIAAIAGTLNRRRRG